MYELYNMKYYGGGVLRSYKATKLVAGISG